MDDIGEAVARAAILRGPNLSITATSYPFVETLQRSTGADPTRDFCAAIDLHLCECYVISTASIATEYIIFASLKAKIERHKNENFEQPFFTFLRRLDLFYFESFTSSFGYYRKILRLVFLTNITRNNKSSSEAVASELQQQKRVRPTFAAGQYLPTLHTRAKEQNERLQRCCCYRWRPSGAAVAAVWARSARIVVVPSASRTQRETAAAAAALPAHQKNK
ncbi:unnamed protein product [Trichogramma brassicae]|uniref:Uncharacterized protein n=1 Tax=Trichogramma brassicae TaxID=86971 RepID=A0A6H5IHJ7_9HYME|nr:unnamed protein product [Trichogramma brassicae]